MKRSDWISPFRSTACCVRPTTLSVVLCMLAACNSGADTDEPAAPAGDGAGADDRAALQPRQNSVLARYHGEYDGRQLTFTPITEAQAAREGQIAQRLTIGSLPTTSAGSTTPPPEPPTTGAQVHQIAAREVDAQCNTRATLSGDTGIPAGFTGVCFRIEAINGFLTQGITRAYVEVSGLVNRNNSGEITVYNNATLDTELIPASTSNIFFNHHISNNNVVPPNNWLAPHGASTTLDRVTRNWYFDTPEAGAMSAFNFTATVYGQVVNPVRRVSPLSSGAVDCAVDPISKPAYSLDGDYVAYVTSDPACSPDGNYQIFRRQISTGQTVLVSHSFGGSATSNNTGAVFPSISRDGRYVAFVSDADNILGAGGTDNFGQVDVNGEFDVFVADLVNNTIFIASTSATATPRATVAGGNIVNPPMIAPQGNYVVFDTQAPLVTADANGLYDVYRRQFPSSITSTHAAANWRLVSAPSAAGRTGDCVLPTVAINGSPVAFECSLLGMTGDATAASSDVYVTVVPSLGNPTATNVALVSKNASGVQALLDSNNIYVSADGNYVAWESIATNMVGPAGLGFRHVYVARRSGTSSSTISGLQRADNTRTGAEAAGDATFPSLTSTGRLVVFNSTATNITPIDTNGNNDAYMFDVRSPDARRKFALVWNTTQTNQLPAAASVSTASAVEGVNAVYGIFMSPSNVYDGSAPAGDNLYLAPLR